MVSNLSQYSPQGLPSQFPGLQGAGWPQQVTPGLFGQPGVSGGNVSFGQDPAQTPFTQNPFLQHPAQHLVTVLGQLTLQLAAHAATTQQIGLALHQLTQQLGAQSLQGYPSGFGAGQAFAGVGPPSPYVGVAQPFGLGGGGQYFGQNPFVGAIQAGYGQAGYSGFNPGFNPQAQAWGANRPQTIQ
jgi:hypothetical protein